MTNEDGRDHLQWGFTKLHSLAKVLASFFNNYFHFMHFGVLPTSMSV